MNLPPTERFSSRVDNYQKYRPGYPAELLSLLERECGLKSTSIVADIGSGTGISAEMFLKHGNAVFAVEPNAAMRAAAERWLEKYDNFHSIDGTAETTNLRADSVDLIAAAQAFHWFKRGKAFEEFSRILRKEGWVVLIWNDRLTDTAPFLRAYEEMLIKFGTDYTQVNHRHIDEAVISSFFGSNRFKCSKFENYQDFDFDGVKGRLLSSSYVPDVGHPNYEPMLEALKEIFERHNTKGRARFEYETIVYYGQLR